MPSLSQSLSVCRPLCARPRTPGAARPSPLPPPRVVDADLLELRRRGATGGRHAVDAAAGGAGPRLDFRAAGCRVDGPPAGAPGDWAQPIEAGFLAAALNDGGRAALAAAEGSANRAGKLSGEGITRGWKATPAGWKGGRALP